MYSFKSNKIKNEDKRNSFSHQIKFWLVNLFYNFFLKEDKTDITS